MPESAPSTLEERVSTVGRRLSETLQAVLETVPGSPHRPQMLATTLGIDKVLTSRLLKATRHRDPVATVHLVPGSQPLRRMLAAARRHGSPVEVIGPAIEAVDDFDRLIKVVAGDRSSLDTMISAWLPEARSVLDARRRQSAFRAMSELKGGRATVNLATTLLHPSEDGRHIDIVWIMGLLGIRRLRPNAPIKFTSRRMASEETPRHQSTLEGAPIVGMNGGVRFDAFCNAPPAPLDVNRTGDVTHYSLAGDLFGPTNEVDLVMAEVNLAEMARYVPAELARKGYVFAEIGLPVNVLLFDVFVHRDVYPDSQPALSIYDTVLEGIADVNDPTRNVDRYDVTEPILSLGNDPVRARTSELSRYTEMMRYVLDKMNWRGEDFRGYRCRLEYPIYGSQVVMAFDPPPPPGD